MDVRRVISLLKLARTLSPQDVATLYKGFLKNISTDEQIIEVRRWKEKKGPW